MQSSGLKDRLRFFNFSEDDGSLSKSIWPVLKAELPQILESFYKHLKREPHLAELIGTQQDRLIAAQVAHWEALFTEGPTEIYVERAERIGLAHVRIGLEPTWYIGGYSFALTQLNTLLIGKRFQSSGKKRACSQSGQQADHAGHGYGDLDLSQSDGGRGGGA